jgi:hypothetical protein
MALNSRRKGKGGELEFAELLRSHGYEARRGVQFLGGPQSPDVIHNIPGIHFEVKRCEAGNLYVWLAQAIRDAGDNTPIVAHRRNDRDWVAILPMWALLGLIRAEIKA